MGYSVVSTVLSSAASYDLTDLATAKDELSIDAFDFSDDTWIARAISQVSKAISTYTKRTFAPEQLQDVFDVQQDAYPYQTPGGFAQLELSRWPVLGVTSVVQTLALGSPPTTQTLIAGKDFRLDPATGRLLRLNPFTGSGTLWEAIPVTVTYAAGYGALVAETGTVPGSAAYTVTVSQAADFSCDLGVSYPTTPPTPLTPVAANPAQGQYAVDDGVYTFNAADAGQSLAFAYATAAIPDDLVEICLRLITNRYAAKDRDPALIVDEQPGIIGTKRYWFGGAPGQKGPFPPDVQGLLDSYRTPTIG